MAPTGGLGQASKWATLTATEVRMNRTILWGFLLAALLAACSTSLTGRKQLAFLPESTMSDMGVQAFAQIKEQVPAGKSDALNRYVNCVADAVVAQAPKSKGSPSSWEVVVFEDDTANAFALPGGKIGVHTGILAVATTPGQLAAILGHEVSHVLLRHGNERASQTLLAQGALGLASLSVGSMDPGQQQIVLGALGAGAQVGVLLPFSRKHESESDVLGQNIMADAGFDPIEAITLWENMAKLSGGQPPEFLSTHPGHQTRIDRLKKNLSAANKRSRAAKAAGRVPTCKAPPPPAAPANK